VLGVLACVLFAGLGLVRSVEAALVIVVDRWRLQPSTPPGS